MQRIAPESPSQNSFPEQREDDFYGRMANMVLLLQTCLQLHGSTIQTQEGLGALYYSSARIKAWLLEVPKEPD